jgi:hypothetical protein
VPPGTPNANTWGTVLAWQAWQAFAGGALNDFLAEAQLLSPPVAT